MDESLGYMECGCGEKFQVVDENGGMDNEATGEALWDHYDAEHPSEES